MARLRTPTSAPRERTNNGTASLRLRRIARHFGRRHAARVIAVIAHAGTEEEFRFIERPKDDAQFRTADRDFVAAGVRLLQDRIHRSRIIVAAPAGGGLEPIGPVHRVLDIDAGIAFADVVEERVRQELALHRIGQRQRDVVVARLHAEHGFARPSQQRALDGARDATAAVSAIVVLVELVAIGRIGQEPGEIVVKIEPVFHHIAVGLPLSAVVGLRQPRRQREAIGVAAVGGIDLAIETDQARRDSAQWNLVGGIPSVRIGHGGRRKAVGRGALAETQQAGELVHVIGRVPRTVISVHLARVEQRAAAEFCRAHAEIAQIVEAADGGFGDGLVDAVAQIDEQRAGGGEIADVGEVRSLADIQAGDGLRHQPIEVGVALPVSMGRQVDRHVVDEDRQIRAVIEIVTAQIILIGLAAIGMHDHGEAGHGFENLARSRHRECVELLPSHRHLARHGRQHRSATANVRRAGDVRRRR